MDPPAKKAKALSKEQAAVYDRQLRVWGVEAQQRCDNPWDPRQVRDDAVPLG